MKGIKISKEEKMKEKKEEMMKKDKEAMNAENHISFWFFLEPRSKKIYLKMKWG